MNETESGVRRAALHALAGALLMSAVVAEHLVATGYPGAGPELAWLLAWCALCGAALGMLARALPAWVAQPLLGVLVVATGILVFDVVSAPAVVAALIAGGVAGGVLRAHAGTVTCAIAAAFLLGLLPAWRPTEGIDADARPTAPEPVQSLPLIVHLVLDGHLGPAAIPQDLAQGAAVREALVARYQAMGFRIFPRAYSPFSGTALALADTFNFGDGVPIAELLEDGLAPYDFGLRRNDYFARLAGMGFRLSVIQTDHLQLCGAGPAERPASCRTHRSDLSAPLARAPLGASDKAAFILRASVGGAALPESLRRAYNLHFAADGTMAPLAAAPKVSALAGHEAIESLLEALRSASAGEAHIAHILLPHEPFAFAADCALKPLAAWGDSPVLAPEGPLHTASTRAEAYAAYLDQLLCVTTLVERVIELLEERSLLADALIIVHGDHGGRISLQPPRDSDPLQFSDRDLVDTHATLFAIRPPGGDAASDPRVATPRTLLIEALGGAVAPAPPTIRLPPDQRPWPYRPPRAGSGE